MKTRCTEVTNHDHQWEVYLLCAFLFFFLYYLIWMPKIWCFFWFSFGQVSMGALSSLTHDSDLCLFPSLSPFFFLPGVCWSVTVHVRSPVCNACLSSYCWKTATRKKKKPKLKKKKNCCHDFFAVNVCTLCFSAIVYCNLLCSSQVTHVFEHHLYVALYLCNSCSCDYDGFVVLGLTSLESVAQRTS